MNRYQNIPQTKLNGRLAYVTSRYPEVPLSSDDIYVYTTQGDRFDVLALQYYGDSSLWWIISIAKRYLILSNQKNYKKRVETSSITSIEEDEKFSYQLDDSKSTFETNLSRFVDEYVNHCTNNIFDIFPKESDAQVADAILELFRKRESLDVFNKKALYIYIREMIDVKTPKITKVADKLYDIFKEKYVFYLEQGYTNF